MPRYPRARGRRSIRLPGYDYTAASAYFVTIVTQDRACILSDVRDGIVHLSAAGRIAASAWRALANHVPGLVLDRWVVMPNHVHGIVVLSDRRDPPLRVALAAWRSTHPISPRKPRSTAAPVGPAPRSLGAIIGAFKSGTTRRINRLRGTPGATVWQRDYYERIIDDEAMLARIRQYIAANPRHWAADASAREKR